MSDDPRPTKKLKTLSERSSLHRNISPPPLRRPSSSSSSSTNTPAPTISVQQQPVSTDAKEKGKASDESADGSEKTLLVPSPFRLMRIKHLPASENVDAVTLQDLVGDPLLKHTYQINFMFDIPFFMNALDSDTRDATKVTIVHGSWKQESQARIEIEQEAKKFENMNVIIAYLPDPFGTHHSKMMVNFRHDDTAEVVVHTANMIEFDWTNMSQGAWVSPRLPLLASESTEQKSGVGYEFKTALLAYFEGYGRSKLKKLTDELKRYDFSAVRAVFVGHVPGKHLTTSDDVNKLFGYSKVAAVMRRFGATDGGSTVAMQVSSIATLGATDKYLQETLLPSFCPRASMGPTPRLAIVFPTAEDVRTSVNGWMSGGSIHLKGSSAAAIKQLAWLQSYFHRWGQTAASSSSSAPQLVRAGRHKAAPHIKTYTSFKSTNAQTRLPDVNWSLLTSANLSRQAWGAAPSKEGTVHVQSYEAGVLVHPSLWQDLSSSPVQMRAVGKSDWITPTSSSPVVKADDAVLNSGGKYDEVIVSVRIPYDYPLSKIKTHEAVWVTDKDYGDLRDWKGLRWPPRDSDMMALAMAGED